MRIAIVFYLIVILTTAAKVVGQESELFLDAPNLSVPVVQAVASLHANDFNGDGRLDLAMISGRDGKLAMLLNQGDSPFQKSAMQLSDAGTSASAMTVSDIDEDGRLDVAIAHHDTDEIWILIGKGDGTFQPPLKIMVPVVKAHSHTIASADVNRDTHVDLMLAQADDNRAWVFLGDGKGGFVPSPGSPIETGDHPYDVVSDDFNKDGSLDIATPNWRGKSISVFLGDGTGRFTPAPGSPLTGFESPTALDAGDVNGDGIVDLALGSDDLSVIQILIGDGTGAFNLQAITELQALEPCFSPTLADLNGDGSMDGIANSQNRAQTFSHWVNLGRGKFSRASTLKCPAGAASICVADFNDDDLADLAVGTSNESKILIWFGTKRK